MKKNLESYYVRTTLAGDDIHLNFSQGGFLYMSITLACIIFGEALDIKPE